MHEPFLPLLGVEVANVRMIDAPGENHTCSLSFEERSEGGSKKFGGPEVPRFCVHLLYGKNKIKYCVEVSVSNNQMQRVTHIHIHLLVLSD